MPKNKKRNRKYWFLLGLLGVLIAAPNATVIRFSVAHEDPFLFNLLRFGAGALVCLPFLLVGLHRFTRKNIKDATLAGLFIAIAVTSNVFAIKMSAASYVSIITLITPIIMVILSAKIVGEKITPRAIAGISLAAVGATTIILLPIAIHQGASFVFYPEATLFALINTISFPLAMIYSRRANEKGVPFMPLMGYTAGFVVAVNAACFVLFSETKELTIAPFNPWLLLYSGVAVALLVRMLNVICYEKIGAATVSGLSYLEIFLAILLPVLILGEILSLPMIVGGALILLGVYVIEHHKSKHHKHFHTHYNR
ncbi:MAG: DMT family transporter [Candidatus Saccharimonas sp.]